ncbi:MAG: hypothetical protein ABUL60_08995 [Myxococcales bacterium]
MRHVVSLVCVAFALTTRMVRAQELAGPDLSWEAPAGCPQLSDVRARIDAIAGSSVKRETRLQAQGRVTKEDNRFHLKLVVREGALTGERNITSDSCEDLAGATAVALGLMLRSATPLSESALSGADSPDASGTTKPPAAPAAPPPSNPETPAAPSQPTASTGFRWRALVRLPAAVADFGPLPNPNVGVALAAGGRFDQWRFLVAGQLWLNQTVHGGADLPSYSARVRRQTATLTLGRAFRWGSFELAPCLVLALERIAARGAGDGVAPSEAQAVWLSTGAAFQGSLALSKTLAIFADVGARVQLSRPVIAIDGLGDLRQLRPIGLSSGLGLEWSF